MLPDEIKPDIEAVAKCTEQAIGAYALAAAAHHYSQEAADILGREALAPAVADAIFALQSIYNKVK